MILALLLILTVACFYIYIKWSKNYWSRRGLEVYESTALKKPKYLLIADAYNYFKSKKVKHGGLTLKLKQIYIPIDLEIIRCITVKYFDHFVNHSAYCNEKADPFTGNLLFLKDDKWKAMRAYLNPTFSSAQMKAMFPSMKACCEEMVNTIENHSNNREPVEVKNLSYRYIMETVCFAGFGIKSNCLKNPNSEFMQLGSVAVQETWRTIVSRFVPLKILTLINFRITPKHLSDFFTNLTRQIIKHREINDIHKKDLMTFLLELKEQGKLNSECGNITINELAAQVFVFFFGSLASSSSILTFALFELAQSTLIQDKLRKEIKSVIEEHGNLTYEAVMRMEYLNQVFNETLRRYPVSTTMGRTCNKDFHVPGTDLVIEKGTSVLIPIIGVHWDSEYYPEPHKFIPERFSPENKISAPFFPFGNGPRICIGKNYGVLNVKLGLIAILTNFEVKINRKTIIPIEYEENFILLTPKENVWINFSKLA